MTQLDIQPGKVRTPQNPFNLRLASLGVQIGCLTLVILILGLLGGLWLDRILKTKPIFTIILVLGSAPVALFLTYWVAMQAVKDINLPSPKRTKSLPPKEEDSGE